MRIDNKQIENLWKESGNILPKFAKLVIDETTVWTHWHDPDHIDILESPPWVDDKIVSTTKVSDLDEIQILPPCEPTKIVGLALNYKGLVGSQNEYPSPLIFLKSPNALIGYNEPLPCPPSESRTWLEVELAMVIGRKAQNVPVENALEYVCGFTIANDITTENIENRDHHLAYSKSQDGFCPLGPFLIPNIETDDLQISSWVDQSLKQSSGTSDRILNDAETIAYITRHFTLMPGDVVMTGSCDGWREATITPGCIMKLSIENIGILRNPVI